jgi:hypothetical protein
MSNDGLNSPPDGVEGEELKVTLGGTQVDAVVIDLGHRLELAAIGQPDPTHDVQLPQLHRPGPFSASPGGLAPPPGLGLDETVAYGTHTPIRIQ